MPTPKYLTVRRVISRETIEQMYTKDEISKVMRLASYFDLKPDVQWFFCVFVFSVERESLSTLRITAVSTTVARTHKYTITPGLLDVAPEITLKDDQNIWQKVVKAHFEAEDLLILRKINNQEMSGYTRRFMDNGAAEEERLEFVIYDLDYDPNPKKTPGLFLVQ